jgi:hypothetical protein
MSNEQLGVRSKEVRGKKEKVKVLNKKGKRINYKQLKF